MKTVGKLSKLLEHLTNAVNFFYAMPVLKHSNAHLHRNGFIDKPASNRVYSREI